MRHRGFIGIDEPCEDVLRWHTNKWRVDDCHSLLTKDSAMYLWKIRAHPTNKLNTVEYYVTFPGSVYACANRPSFDFLFGMALWQLLRNQILCRDVQSHTGRHAYHCNCCSPASGGIWNAGDEIEVAKPEILINLDLMYFFPAMDYWLDRPILTCYGEHIKDYRSLPILLGSSMEGAPVRGAVQFHLGTCNPGHFMWGAAWKQTTAKTDELFFGGYENRACQVKSLSLDVVVASGLFAHSLRPNCTQQDSTSPVTHQQDWMEASGSEMMKRSRECVPQELRSCHQLSSIRVLTQTSVTEGRTCTAAKLVSVPSWTPPGPLQHHMGLWHFKPQAKRAYACYQFGSHSADWVVLAPRCLIWNRNRDKWWCLRFAISVLTH